MGQREIVRSENSKEGVRKFTEAENSEHMIYKPGDMGTRGKETGRIDPKGVK